MSFATRCLSIVLSVLLFGCAIDPKFTVTVTTDGQGTVTMNPDRLRYSEDDLVALTAIPDSGWQFDRWEGDFSGTTTPANVSIDDDLAITAVFVEETPSFSGDNNRARFYSADFDVGTGTAATGLLVRQLLLSVSAAGTLDVGTAFSSRGTLTSDWADVVVPVTNTGDSGLAFIKAESIRFLNSSGSLVRSDTVAYVYGSVGQLTSVQTSSCLAPGETGYLIFIEEDLWTALSSMSFSLSAYDRFPSDPGACIRPTAVEYGEDEYWGWMDVQFENQGQGTGSVGALGNLYVVYDAGLVPIEFGFLSEDLYPYSGQVTPGSVGSVSDSTIFTDGSGRYVDVLLSFADEGYDDVSSPEPRTLGWPASAEAWKASLDERNARLADLERAAAAEADAGGE